MDSDDWVDKDYIESLMPDNEETDITVSGFIRHDADKETPKKPQGTELLSMQQAEQCIYTLEKSGFLNMPWSKMYSKAIIDKHGISFPPQYSYGEDKLFLFNYLIHCNNIQIKAGNSYHYITAEQGLSARRHPMEKIWSWNEELLETYAKLGARFGFSSDTIKKMCSRSYTYFTLYMANTIYYEPYSNKQRVSLVRRIYNRRRDANLLNRKECRGIVRKAAAMLYEINIPQISNAIYNMVCTKQGKGMMR